MAENEQWDIVSGVGVTALGVAGARAGENRRPDRIAHDPYAEALVTAANSGLPLLGDEAVDAIGSFWHSAVSYMGVRTRFFDDFFERAAADGIRQAVILASGLDTRAFRLSWPDGSRVFEIDQPLILNFKDRTLQDIGATPTSEHHPIPIDLREDWATALTEGGFDATLPTAWLAEGLLLYLPADAEHTLLRTAHEFSAPGSRIAIENYSGPKPSITSSSPMQEVADSWGIDVDELFSGETRPEAGATLTALGWELQRVPAPELARRFGRDVEEYFATLDGTRTEFLTAALPG
ncbi:SAM-dependent methyltransferase [Saccharopolyspora sp. HNM0983]|uniref:S-adenosyl-L-methionine-dependent methyltransferase n=1 Tax=Saccharopolyspora montiporae TaxID=2781240 RepID=A0A929BCL6_9PSEU|nr:SAM-dependent methyltransferase [Saccharopolyspora sp. HNM0983]